MSCQRLSDQLPGQNVLRSGDEPCAPRTQILASRLLDIIIHDEARVNSMTVVVSERILWDFF